MCFPMKCSSCGQTSWGGCGKHVPSVYQKIPSGQVCMCKPWPGVEFPKAPAKESAKDEKATKEPGPATAATTAV